MLSLLTGSEEKARQLQTDMLGYGAITAKNKESVTFNEQHSKLAGEAIADTVVKENDSGNFISESYKLDGKNVAAPEGRHLVNSILNDNKQTSVDINQLNSAVDNFKQASNNQIDTVARQSEITTAAITTTEIDSNVNTITQQPAIESQQLDSGDRIVDVAAAASNAAAIEGLVNKSPNISPPASEETYIIMP
jgi:hypothetical protein